MKHPKPIFLGGIPQGSPLPKGAYRLPNGDIVLQGKPFQTLSGKSMRVTAVRRARPDYESLARALLRVAEELNKEDSDRAA